MQCKELAARPESGEQLAELLRKGLRVHEIPPAAIDLRLWAGLQAPVAGGPAGLRLRRTTSCWRATRTVSRRSSSWRMPSLSSGSSRTAERHGCADVHGVAAGLAVRDAALCRHPRRKPRSRSRSWPYMLHQAARSTASRRSSGNLNRSNGISKQDQRRSSGGLAPGATFALSCGCSAVIPRRDKISCPRWTNARRASSGSWSRFSGQEPARGPRGTGRGDAGRKVCAQRQTGWNSWSALGRGHPAAAAVGSERLHTVTVVVQPRSCRRPAEIIFDDQQWRLWNQAVRRYAGMEQHLRQQGILDEADK